MLSFYVFFASVVGFYGTGRAFDAEESMNLCVESQRNCGGSNPYKNHHRKDQYSFLAPHPFLTPTHCTTEGVFVFVYSPVFPLWDAVVGGEPFSPEVV